MNMKKYKVTCLKCKGSNEAVITEVRKDDFSIDLNADHRRNPDNIHIISGRYRKDMNFGWECLCSNTSLLARQEFPEIKSLVSGGDESAIEKITKSLGVEDKKKFSMVEV